jgi:tRNA (guanine37-N1)-methyltransferase
VKYSILSLFPEQVYDALRFSMTARAMDRGLIELNLVQIRDFAINEYGQVDDAPYGGGRGMVMMCEPIYNAWRSVVAQSDANNCDQIVNHVDEKSQTTIQDSSAYTIFLSPAGKTFDQKMALELSKKSHIAFICGHYEGVDARVIEEIGAYEVSLGDFVLTGGELAAAVMIDAITRLLPGVLPDEEGWQLESFSGGLLEWPQYTRPRVWRDRAVPDVLLSGHQANIERERDISRLVETITKRPELLKGQSIDRTLWELVAKRFEDPLF